MNDTQLISDVIKTREILIYDDENRLRIALHGREPEPKISLYKMDGTPAVEISSFETDTDSRRITLFGKAHKWRLKITCNESGAEIIAFDASGRISKEWDLLHGDDGPQLIEEPLGDP